VLAVEETVSQTPEARPTRKSFSEWVETWLLPWVDDLSLWPVLFALLGHVMVFLSPLFLFAYRTGNPVFHLAILVFIGISLHIIKSEREYRGHFGGITGALVVLWSGSAAFAVVCEITQIL
jgi:hypothetical protein